MSEAYSPLHSNEQYASSSSSSGKRGGLLLQRWDFILPSKRNYLFFCTFFSIVHAAVDAVLAFASAELGTNLGSLGGFVLYIFYTVSALILAKPVVQLLESRRCVFLGLISLLIYVSGFYLAILIPSMQEIFFITGCAIGGIGAGILWTGQGTYYSLNATNFAQESQTSRTEAVTVFAGIFAAYYLSFETGFKFIGTVVFLADNSNDGSAWRSVVFGIYTLSAFISTILFWMGTCEYHDIPTEPAITEADGDSEQATTPTTTTSNHRSPLTSTDLLPVQTRKVGMQAIFEDSLSVGKAIFTIRKLQLLIPFQVCFGLSSGLVDTYVNGVIVKAYIGEGYIGLLSGLVTLSAALLSGPYVILGNRWQGHGKAGIMVFGGICFALGGLMLVTLNDHQIASWPVIILYYIIHGAARAVFENTNKATIADYFPQNEVREVAFATVYFSSGLAGAMGFAFFQFLNKYSIAVINLVISFVAICSFLSAQALHEREKRQQKVAMVSTLVTVASSDDVFNDESKANSDGSVDEGDDMLKSNNQSNYQRIYIANSTS